MSKMRLFTYCLALLALTPSLARATVVVVPAERELVARADTIALATVLRVETFLNAAGHAMTQVELQAVRGVKGVADNGFVIAEVPGGPLPNGLVAKVVGAPEPRVGDLVFLFLANTAGAGRPIAMSYGWLEVRRDAEGTLRASHRLDGLSMLRPRGQEDTPVLTLANEPVDALVARVRAHMRALAIPDPNAAAGTVHR